MFKLLDLLMVKSKIKLCCGNLETLVFTTDKAVSLQHSYWYLVIVITIVSCIHIMLSESKVDNGEMSPFNFLDI